LSGTPNVGDNVADEEAAMGRARRRAAWWTWRRRSVRHPPT